MSGANPKYLHDSDPRFSQPGFSHFDLSTSGKPPLRLPDGAATPILKQHEVTALPKSADLFVRQLRSWVAEEFQEYREILDRIYNGRLQLLRRFETWHCTPDNEFGWVFYIEFAFPYTTLPRA